MSYSQNWLESPSAVRVILVVAKAYNITTSVEDSFYFSNNGYVTTDGYTFDPVIANEITLQESISSGSETSMTFGDIELHNLNGELDQLLDITKYIWKNRSITIYYGDPGWKYSLSQIDINFLKIFDGVINDIDSRTTKTVNLKVRDKLERLNGPISENKIGTYGVWAAGQQNQDQLRPIVFGECFNISPILIDPSTLEYCFSTSTANQATSTAPQPPQNIWKFTGNGTSEELLEIRDNGVPIYIYNDNTTWNSITLDSATSTFKLKSPPAGTITCSIQGVKKSMNLTTGQISDTYVNSIPSIIGVIVTGFGKAATRLTASELDLTSFSNFDQTTEVGLLVDSAENVLTVCQKLASSVGGQLIMSRTGQLRLLRFGVSTSTTPITITSDDILYDSLSIGNKLDIKGAFKIAYGKNYTVQNNLTTAIPETHKNSFATEWYIETATNSNNITLYKLGAEPEQIETCIISSTDALAEANRLLTYYGTQRIIYSFTGSAKLLSLVLGQQVVLQHPRFGLENGKTGQVVGLSANWSRDRIDVEVVI